MPGDVLGGDLALLEGGVRKLPVAGDIADGVDVRLAGAACAVGADAALLVEGDADVFKTEGRVLVKPGWLEVYGRRPGVAAIPCNSNSRLRSVRCGP